MAAMRSFGLGVGLHRAGGAAVATLALACCTPSRADDYFGVGGSIPDFERDVPGVLVSTVFVSDARAVEALTVTLDLLQHTFAGDLIATLTHVETGSTQTLFHRIGALVPPSIGDSSDFGAAYAFGDTATGDLWAAAAAQPPTGIIPGGAYWATGPFAAAQVPLLAPFKGESSMGTWSLTLTDMRAGNTGLLATWTLSLNPGIRPDPCAEADHDCGSIGGPGCTDAGCCASVCALNAACCEIQWNYACISAAESLCGIVVPCPAATHDCFTAGEAGCTDGTCCTAVCDSYSGCCVLQWDEYCISLASGLCEPPPPTCPPSDHICLVEGTAGCTDVDCCLAVCEVQPACCTVAWDAGCVSQTILLCGLPYFACSSGTHSCFQIGGPGCSDPACCLAVCDADIFCCSAAWDQACVDSAIALCGLGGEGFAAEFHATPAEWMENPVRWIRDMEPVDTIAPLNGIDVLIDGSNEAIFDIVVNFRRCPQPEDLAFLIAAAPGAKIQLVGRYVTFVLLANVPKASLDQIAASPWVAFIERQMAMVPLANTSVRAVRVRSSSTYFPNTVEDALPWITGSGANIVIMDTGVDNSIHQAFASTPFIGGYNAVTGTFGDPDDDYGHGTDVASVALGQSYNPMPFVPDAGRGVAPAAGLIDVKMIDGNGCGNYLWTIDAIEKVYDKRDAWNVDVINMSFGAVVASDGKDAVCQLVNLAESMGICVVVAAGNEGPVNPVLGVPASATRAITVGASDDVQTVFRDDDLVAFFSNRGPRSDDLNGSAFDELKPEVVAPGVHITAALHDSPNGASIGSGTSLAAPHVAGIVALLRQMFADINCLSIRCLLTDSATQLPGYLPSLPGVDPTWNAESGWGLVDGYGVFLAGPLNDIGFPSYPSSPAWLSPDLDTEPFPPKVGQPTVVRARIFNNSADPVPNVLVEFGIHDFTTTTDSFSNIGIKRVTLAPGLNTITMDWTPASAGHRCISAEVGYCRDTWFANNKAQRNIEVAMSPVAFEVSNTLTVEPQLIELDVSIAGAGWTVELTPPFAVLGATDCPIQVVALAHPPLEAPAGATTTIDIGARIGTTPLDGVTILATKEDCNGNGEDDYFDILNGTSMDADVDGTPDECQTTCPADLDDDGIVDGADLGLMLSGWGGGGSSDLDGSGTTDGADLGLLLAAWGKCAT